LVRISTEDSRIRSNMDAQQVVATLLEVQRQVQLLQQGAVTNAQTMATMQGAVAAMQANQGGEGPRDRDHNNETKMNHGAGKSLQPAQWAGDDDHMSFQEFSAEFTNFANALNPGSKHILDQATRVKGVIDLQLDLMDQPLVEGLAEALDGEVYRQLYKSTKKEARRVVHNAGSGNGLQAWLNLNNAYAPRSATDAAVAMKRVMYPVRVKTEDKMPIELQKWLADLLEFEQRFHPMDDTSKRCGLQMLLPETMWQNRMAGQQYESFDHLLKHVKDLVGDRTLAAMKTRPASHHQGPQPMDIGQFDESGSADLNAVWGKGKGGKGKGAAGWGPPAWEQPQKSDKGKGKGKGKKGDKGKGKGKDVQCWTCSGWGHRSNQCPSGDHHAGGKGVNEVGEEAQGGAPDEGTTTADGEENEEEPAWLGALQDIPEAFKVVQPKKVKWSPMNVYYVNYNRNPTTTTTTTTTPTTRPKVYPRRYLLGPRWPKGPQKEDYNQFSLLEDAEEEEQDDGSCELMVVTTKTDTHKWMKVTTIIDSGAVEHVLPEAWVPAIHMEASPGSRAGKRYLSATGQEIPNMGQKKLTVKTKEGQMRGIVFQVAPVRKPLVSVAKMCEAGNDVVLSGKSPHIVNHKTKQVTALRREGKTFVLDLWVRLPQAAVDIDMDIDVEMKDIKHSRVINRTSGLSRPR
jgi:hypothetical protein